MARVFITGSSDGLGLMVGQLLGDQGHKVVLHARNDARADDAKTAAPKAEAIVVGDLASIAATKDLAAQVNALGSFDAVIHNAAVGYREGQRPTSDGLPHVFAINTLAPYVLTMLIERPKRLVYLSSGMHERANANLDDILWRKRPWDGSSAYAESKLHDVMLAFTVARLWKNVLSNAVTPGWVPTKMGGAGRPTTSTRRISRKRGSRPATTPRRRPPAAISITSSVASRTPRRGSSRCKTGSSISAGRFPESPCRGVDQAERSTASPPSIERVRVSACARSLNDA